MKFRYKILILNLIILSIGISIIGYFMIKKNYQLAIDNQIRNTLEENNLLQSSIEYRLLDILATQPKNLDQDLASISNEACQKLDFDSENVQILLDEKTIFPNSTNTLYSEKYLNDTVIGKKYYYMVKTDNEHYIYAYTRNILMDNTYTIINRKNVTDIYAMIKTEQKYFSYLLFVTISICSILLFIISTLLTRPLEKLNRTSASFGNGDYSIRSDIKSNDEIGVLSDTYNQMADSIEEHVSELIDMLERRDQFVADFTHELKTPMTSIIGYSDMIRSKELSREKQILSASYIFNEGKRLEAMSLKLFDFIYAKNHEIEFKEFSTALLVEKVKNSVTPLLSEKEIHLNCKVENIMLSGDIDLLTSTFINLIDNARKASNKGGEINFYSKTDSDSYKLIVQDFGTGIAKEHLDKIFNEFYMTDKSRSRKEGGAGLGLSLALTIIEAHHASLDIESELGKGTTVIANFKL